MAPKQSQSLAPVRPAPVLQRKFSARYQRSMIVYVGIEGPGLRGLGSARRSQLVDSIRKQIESRRFIVLSVPIGKARRGEVVNTLVKAITLKSQGIAKMRTAWNSQFQGYPITSAALKAIQNASYLYFVELLEVRGTKFSNAKAALNLAMSLLGQSLPDTPPTYAYHMRARLHIHKVAIFRCTQWMKKKGGSYYTACRNKMLNEYSGFVYPFKTIDTKILGVPRLNWNDAYAAALQVLGRSMLKKLGKFKDFNLHGPVTKSQLENVWFKLGKNEGVKLGTYFRIKERRVGGKLVERGLVKVTQIGDNRMKMVNQRKVRVNPKAPLFSMAQIVSTNGTFYLRRGMMAYEYPMTGMSIGFFPGLHLPLIKSLGATNDLPFGFTGRFTFDLDMSAKTNVTRRKGF